MVHCAIFFNIHFIFGFKNMGGISKPCFKLFN